MGRMTVQDEGSAVDTGTDEWGDLLPDDLSGEGLAPKSGALPVVRTSAQQAAAIKRAEAQREADQLRAAQDAAKARAARLAQIVNLHIAGYSLADIGAAVGSTAEEIDRMLASDTQRYVRSQPSLRIYVRNWISERYTKMIEADWDIAVDKNHPEKLDNQDRVMRMLDKMGRLHGADMPAQSEVKVDAAPEAVERLVQALSTGHGLGYDTSVFDVVDGEVVAEDIHRAVEQAGTALEVSGNRVAEGDDSGF